jgi:hypothetical protein
VKALAAIDADERSPGLGSVRAPTDLLFRFAEHADWSVIDIVLDAGHSSGYDH